MARIMPRSLQAYRIRQEMVKHGWDPEEVDVDALIDGTLSYQENRQNIAQMLKYKTRSESARQEQKKADHGYCNYVRERCELESDKSACKSYVKEGCGKAFGKLDVPQSWVSSKKKPKKPKQDDRCELGKFWVNGYSRFCGRCKNDSGTRGKQIQISGHCRKKSGSL